MAIMVRTLAVALSCIVLGCSSSSGSASEDAGADAAPANTGGPTPGGPAPDAGAPTTPSAVPMCSMVTPAIAAALVGAPVKLGPSNVTEYQCQYVGDAAFGTKEYSYQVAAAYLPSSRAAFETAYSKIYTPLAGIGDVAFLQSKTATVKDGEGTTDLNEVTIVTFYKGWNVSLGGRGAGVSVDAVTQQMKTLLTKIPQG